jgi:GNAT superfamily N-acetyltransferase
MYHFAVIGMTGSGKTFGAQCMAEDYRRRGIGTLVLHKPNESWPSSAASWQTDHVPTFLRMYDAARQCACFMELADAEASKYDADVRKTFTQGRHTGHRNYFLAQRGAQVHPDVRENCIGVFMFNQVEKSARLWADDFNEPGFIKAPIPPAIIDGNTGKFGAMCLPPHWCFYKPNRFAPIKLMKFKR